MNNTGNQMNATFDYKLTYMSISSISNTRREADMITPLSDEPVDCIDCTDKWSSVSD